jgi:hypothetical protein
MTLAITKAAAKLELLFKNLTSVQSDFTKCDQIYSNDSYEFSLALSFS